MTAIETYQIPDVTMEVDEQLSSDISDARAAFAVHQQNLDDKKLKYVAGAQLKRIITSLLDSDEVSPATKIKIAGLGLPRLMVDFPENYSATERNDIDKVIVRAARQAAGRYPKA